MDLNNLKNKHPQLIRYLEDNSYSCSYICRIKTTIDWILDHDNDDWTSYRDVFEDRITACASQSPIVHKVLKAIISAIYRFDIFDEFPCRIRHTTHLLIPISSTDKLNPEFHAIIERFIEVARNRGLKESTVDSISGNTAAFLLSMQDKEKTSLEMISEDDLLDYMLTGNKGGRFCADKSQILRIFLKHSKMNRSVLDCQFWCRE